MKKRVVVTGVGAVTPLGTDTETTWKGLINGQSGVGPISLFDSSGFETQIAAEVKDFKLHSAIAPKHKRYLSRSSSFGLQAFLEAVSNAELSKSGIPSDEIGVSMGCGLIYPELEVLHNIYDQYNCEEMEEPKSFLGPQDLLKRSGVTGAALMGGLIEASGPMLTINTACASSAHAIGLALRTIQSGEATVMVAGGYDSMINYIDLLGFGLLGALSTNNIYPKNASRPFDKNRDGFVIGEGASVVVLEEYETAISRGAPILGEIVGYSSTMNAYRITDSPPDGGACITVMVNAMKDAGLAPEDIDYIAVHGTSTPYNDYSETISIKKALGDAALGVAASSIKSMIGHLTNAAGGINLISTLLAMRDNIIPPTINYSTQDPKLDLDYVPNTARKKEINAALVNAFAFGGTNACIAVKRVKE